MNEVLKAVIIAGKQEASFPPSSLIPRSNTKIAPPLYVFADAISNPVSSPHFPPGGVS